MDIKTRAKTRTHIWQNEYFIWATQDPHFKSYSTLKTERSQQISKLLGRPKLPAEDENCLGCHALKPLPHLQAREFAPEGVSCESCHGPSSGWFEKHFLLKSSTKESIQYGMYAIRDAERRSARCLTCHVGTEKYEVDHQMIAAGHPDLFFELDLFSAKMPRHWATPNELNQVFQDVPKDPNYEVRLWAVGQAVQLHAALDRLTWRAERAQHPAPGQLPKWPELSELDCFSCHHSVNSNWLDPNYDRFAANSHPQGFDSWRQNHGYKDATPGYGDREPGSPPWNSAHYTIFRILLRAIDPDDSADLEVKLRNLYQDASKLNSSAQQVYERAGQAGKVAARLVEKIAGKFPYPPNASSLDKNLLLRVMLEISAEGDHIAYQDTRSAEQAYMALESLFRSYAEIMRGDPLSSDKKPSSAGKAIQALYGEFDNPSGYSAPRFAEKMHQVNQALGGKNIAAKRPLERRITRKLQIRQPHSAN